MPCDNRDDLCSEFEDELNCGVSQLDKILPIASILITSFFLAIYDQWSLRGSKLLEGVKDVSLSLLPSASNSIHECLLITPQQYTCGIRSHQEYRESLQNLVSRLETYEGLLEIR